MEKSTINFGVNQSLFEIFLSIRDPRVGGRVIHPLINIITITLCALICGCDNWKAIEIFANERKRWLSQFIDLSGGIPSDQTISRVLSLIEPEEFERCFSQWVVTISDFVAGDVISIDGKTQRGSSHKIGGKKANHIINAYSSKIQSALASVKTPDKSNEIKGIPILLNSFDIKGMIITSDAMGTQRGIANLIRKKQADYVLSLKANHKRFHKKVIRLFEQAENLGFTGMVSKSEKTFDYGHGRFETREYTALPTMYLCHFKHLKKWRDIQTFVRIKTKRELASGVIETASRYYISSLPLKKFKNICFAIRDHWQIENGLHYKLDVGMREDDCQIYRGHAAQNLGIMRKIVLKLLNDETTHSAGIAAKRLKAALSPRYLRKVIGF